MHEEVRVFKNFFGAKRCLKNVDIVKQPLIFDQLVLKFLQFVANMGLWVVGLLAKLVEVVPQ